MKKYFFLTLLVSINNYAQKNDLMDEVFPIFNVCKLLPDNKQEQCFTESLQDHIEINFLYPKSVWDLNLEAIVNVKFDIDENGKIEDQFNPNGSIKNIAGIFNKEKNVLGMMPHPERMIDESLSGEDGSIFFKNLLNNIK